MADATASEHWAPVAGFEGLYEVSDLGRVRGLDRVVLCRNGVRKPIRGRVLKPKRDRQGRQEVNLTDPDGRPCMRFVHHLVLEAFVGPRPEGTVCCHWDDDSTNNRLSNLRWATREANMADALRNGRNSRAVRTSCPRSHPLMPPNLVPSESQRGRKCLACNRAHSMAANRAREGEVKLHQVDMQALSDLYYAEIVRTNGALRVRPQWLRHNIHLPLLSDPAA